MLIVIVMPLYADIMQGNKDAHMLHRLRPLSLRICMVDAGITLCTIAWELRGNCATIMQLFKKRVQ